MDRNTLAKTIHELVTRRSEGVYWDFKQIHHSNGFRLIHDVLCLANAAHDGPRFLVYGVANNYTLHSIDGDAGRKTQADIAGIFRDNASKFNESRFPTFYLQEVSVQGALLDVLVIEDRPEKPYSLAQSYGKAKAHHVYTRVCDTNTPLTSSAQPHDVERMWRERFGLDSSPIARAKRYLLDSAAWEFGPDGSKGLDMYYRTFPEFTIRNNADVPDYERGPAYLEWTRGEIRIDDNHSAVFDVAYHQTVVARVYWVEFDNGKKSMVAPDYTTVGRGRFYYYLEGSLVHVVQLFMSARAGNKGDHSRELHIGHRSDAASTEARARWGSCYTIPVVRQDELKEFVDGSRRRDHLADVAMDPPLGQREPDEQYELHMRNLLDFDDWKQARKASR